MLVTDKRALGPHPTQVKAWESEWWYVALVEGDGRVVCSVSELRPTRGQALADLATARAAGDNVRLVREFIRREVTAD